MSKDSGDRRNFQKKLLDAGVRPRFLQSAEPTAARTIDVLSLVEALVALVLIAVFAYFIFRPAGFSNLPNASETPVPGVAPSQTETATDTATAAPVAGQGTEAQTEEQPGTPATSAPTAEVAGGPTTAAAPTPPGESPTATPTEIQNPETPPATSPATAAATEATATVTATSTVTRTATNTSTTTATATPTLTFTPTPEPPVTRLVVMQVDRNGKSNPRGYSGPVGLTPGETLTFEIGAKGDAAQPDATSAAQTATAAGAQAATPGVSVSTFSIECKIQTLIPADQNPQDPILKVTPDCSEGLDAKDGKVSLRIQSAEKTGLARLVLTVKDSNVQTSLLIPVGYKRMPFANDQMLNVVSLDSSQPKGTLTWNSKILVSVPQDADERRMIYCMEKPGASTPTPAKDTCTGSALVAYWIQKRDNVSITTAADKPDIATVQLARNSSTVGAVISPAIQDAAITKDKKCVLDAILSVTAAPFSFQAYTDTNFVEITDPGCYSPPKTAKLYLFVSEAVLK